MIEPSADVPADAASPDEIARRFVGTLTQPQVLRLRRLITANAEAFPELGTAWYTRNVQRVLDTLAATFARLAAQPLLRVDDPLLAAHHFAGLLLWLPVNKAMLTGSPQHTETDLDQ
ncbi:TetR/AcrR family transcriptional regulator C-terminal domain-containing protein [Streptomyces sp. 900105245]